VIVRRAGAERLGDIPVTVLVVAKAPVLGEVKTRLAAAVGDRAAADIAAAALLDTLAAVAAAPVAGRVVALTGDLDRASSGAEIRDRLGEFTVIEQRGTDFAERLANAHADAASEGDRPVLQIGMDTPQVTADLIVECADNLLCGDAALGLARDGGWWVLGVTKPAMAECLREVPMSRPDTGAVTLAALRDTGITVRLVAELADVDTVEDVEAVRRICAPGSRFARATYAAGV
jgi:rSAM/selenodomain-associated transferase 1